MIRHRDNDWNDVRTMQQLVRDDFKRRMLEHDPLLTDREIEVMMREALKEPRQS
jgi:hypothetical protein